MNEQTSLESKFDEQEALNSKKYVMTVSLKRCSNCGELKSKSEFSKNKKGKCGLNSVCKKCIYVQSKNSRAGYREEHKDDKREWNFLHFKKGKVLSGYYYGQGICLICGEVYPLIFENHHVVPKDDMVVSLCSNCHKRYRTSNRDEHMITILIAIENSKFIWDSDGQPKGLKPVPMWTADLPLKEAYV